MSIESSYYVFAGTTPSVPSISVNINTVDESTINSASEAYLVKASAYADEYKEVVGQRSYLEDRLMKDLCIQSSVLVKKIDYVNNIINVHVKSDELYSNASENYSLLYASYVTNIAKEFDSLFNTYYMESGSCVLDDNDSNYCGEEAYDTKAYVIGTNITSDTTDDEKNSITVTIVSSGTNFINVIPNASGSAHVYWAYSNVVDESTQSSAYVINYVNDFVISSGTDSSITSSLWVLSSVDSSVVAYTSSLTSDATWTLK